MERLYALWLFGRGSVDAEATLQREWVAARARLMERMG